MPKKKISSDDLKVLLEKASDGLLFPSESDFPFVFVQWAGAAANCEVREPHCVTPEAIATLSGHAAGTAVETVTLDEFFKPVATMQDWFGDDEKAEMKQYQALLAVLKKNLTDVAVYRVGKTDVDAYIVGKTAAGDLAGLSTKLIET